MTLANEVSFPNWQSVAESAVDINVDSPVSMPNYKLRFYDFLYPIARSPTLLKEATGTTTGSLSHRETPSALGYDETSGMGTLYCSFVEFSSSNPSGPRVVNPGNRTDQSPRYPPVGRWVVAWADNPCRLYVPPDGSPYSDSRSPDIDS